MKKIATPLSGLFVIELDRHEDNRGHFARQFCVKEFEHMELPHAIVQINRCHSNKKHTLRGMHYQLPPHAETKIISCLMGSILDVIIDLRPDSKTFMQHHTVELPANEAKCVCVPQGCAHGYFTLTNTTEVLYCVDEFYNPKLERGVRWNDPAFAISWPAQPLVISDKDANHPNFSPALHLPPSR